MLEVLQFHISVFWAWLGSVIGLSVMTIGLISLAIGLSVIAGGLIRIAINRVR